LRVQSRHAFQTSIAVVESLGKSTALPEKKLKRKKDRSCAGKMYQIDDLVIYGSHGVCRVEAIGTLNISGLDDGNTYYTLYPLYQECKIHIPTDTSMFMRPVITFAEAQKLISLIPSIREAADDRGDHRFWEGYYKESIKTHDCIEILRIIKTIYAKNAIAEEQGKKLGQMDEKYMKKAEDLIEGEFAVALGIPKEKVKDYIKSKLNRLE